ncbi:MAG: TolC family protein [Pseudomonadota bacterium]
MSLFRFFIAAACVLLTPVALADQSGAPLPPLSLQQAIALTLERNPELAQFAFQLKAKSARVDAAGLTPAPELNVQLENFLGTGRTRGASGLEATFALSKVIELGNQRQRRVELARTGIDSVDIASKSAQLDVLAEVSRRYIHVASDQEQLRLTELATELAEKTVNEVRRRVKAAKSPEVELHRASIVLTRAEVEQEHAEHELLTSRRKLAAMWGSREVTFGEVRAKLFELPQVADFDLLTTQLASNPDFLRFATEARQRDAEVQLAKAKASSHYTVSAGVRRLQESDDTAFVAGFSMPLFGRKQAQPAIAEAQALREGVEVESAAAKLKAETSLFELVQELKHSITEAETLRDKVLPKMEEALKATEYAYQRGRYGYLEWVDAQRERVAVQRALIESAANAHLFHTEIERLTAAPVSDNATDRHAE